MTEVLLVLFFIRRKWKYCCADDESQLFHNDNGHSTYSVSLRRGLCDCVILSFDDDDMSWWRQCGLQRECFCVHKEKSFH